MKLKKMNIFGIVLIITILCLVSVFDPSVGGSIAANQVDDEIYSSAQVETYQSMKETSKILLMCGIIFLTLTIQNKEK